jgi:hypothetical protein
MAKKVIMLESELEPEFLSLLEVLRRPDPAVVPGSQQERSREVSDTLRPCLKKTASLVLNQ